jgi:hypothetical protein
MTTAATSQIFLPSPAKGRIRSPHFSHSFDILRLNMICDFPQIQGGQQISIFSINLLASLNLLEKTGFIKSDG